MTDGSQLQEILNLQTELATLRGEEATERFAQTLMDSIAEAKGALEAAASGAEGYTDKEAEYQEALKAITDTLGETSEFIKETANISNQVSEGVGKFGETSKEVADTLGEIESAMQQVQDMQKLSEATATEQIRALSEMMGEVAGKLEDLVKLIPGLGAFLEIWRLGMESIATSAAELESIVLLRNRQAREAGLPEPYTILKVGEGKRSARIEEIIGRLEELGVDMDPPTESADGQQIPTDVRNAVKLGLRDAGMTYDEFFVKNAALQTARRKAKRIAGELSDVEGQILVGPATGMTADGVAKREVRAEQLRSDLGAAAAEVEMLSGELQPVGDAVNGYLDRYASDEVNDEWGKWVRSSYDPSYWMSAAAIAAMKDSAGVAESGAAAGAEGSTEAFDAMAEKAAADTEAFESDLDSEDTEFDESAGETAPSAAPAAAVAAGAAAAGMSPGTKKAMMYGGGGLLAGALLVGAFLILPLGGDSDTDAASTSSITAAQVETDSQAEEPTSSTAATTSSTSTTSTTLAEAMGDSADPPSGAEENPASTVRSFEVTEGSLVFEVSVNGDGMAMAESEDTKWYQAIFTFDTTDGAFEIRATWSRGREMKGEAFDQDFNRLGDAVVIGEWTESDTFIITASDYGSDEVPSAVELYIGVRIDNGDDPDTDYGDQVVWESSES